MTRGEAEQAIRCLCSEWARQHNLRIDPSESPSFIDFLTWVQKHHSQYLIFRTTTSVRYDVENWFDQEFKQTWRN